MKTNKEEVFIIQSKTPAGETPHPEWKFYRNTHTEMLAEMKNYQLLIDSQLCNINSEIQTRRTHGIWALKSLQFPQ